MSAHRYEVVWLTGSVVVGKDWSANGAAGKGSKSPQWMACAQADYQVIANPDFLSVAVYRIPKDGTHTKESDCVYLALQSLAEEWRKQCDDGPLVELDENGECSAPDCGWCHGWDDDATT